MNINLFKLASMLGMGPNQGRGLVDPSLDPNQPNQASHGYTIAENRPEVVTAPGVYFPSEKGEVLSPENYMQKQGLMSLIPRQNGGQVNPPFNEDEFQKWYANVPAQMGLNPNSDDPLHYYDWRGAYVSGVRQPNAERHWPSQFKKEGHPNLYINEMDTRTGTPLIPRQFGGDVDPSLFKDKFSVNYGDPTQQGVEAATNTASLTSTPINISPVISPEASLQVSTPTNATPNVSQPTSVNPTPFMTPPPTFKENRRSPIFASDQKAAFDQKWKPYQDMWKNMGGTPLFSRAGQGTVSPNPWEALTEEEERQYLLSSRGVEVPITGLPSINNESTEADILRSRGLLEEPPKSSQDRFKIGESDWQNMSADYSTTPLPEGSMGSLNIVPGSAVGPRDYLTPAEHELGLRKQWETPGYAESRLAEAQKTNPNIINISPGYEKSYYEAHPTEAAAQNIYDMLRPGQRNDAQDWQDFRNRAALESSFGTPASKKAAAEALDLSQKGRITQENIAAQEAGKVFVGDRRNEYGYGAGVGLFNKKTGIPIPGTMPPAKPVPEKNPTELGLIAKSRELGPDGKPTPAAIEAQRILDSEEKRKLSIQMGGIPPLPQNAFNVPQTGGSKNEGALEGLTAEQASVVKKMANYELPIPGSFAMKDPKWQTLMGRAALYDPSFDSVQYGVKSGVRKSFTSGKDKDNLVSLNTAVGHIDSLVKAKNELANSNWVMGNAAVNLLAKYFPATPDLIARQGAVTGVKTKFNAVKDEMAAIFKRSGATDVSIKAWGDTIEDPSTATPKMWTAFINGALELMGSRIDTLRNTYEQGMGRPKDFAFLSNNSRKILKGLGVDVNAIDPVAGQKMPLGGGGNIENLRKRYNY